MNRQQVTTWFIGAVALSAMMLATPGQLSPVTPAQAEIQAVQLPSVADLVEIEYERYAIMAIQSFVRTLEVKKSPMHQSFSK